MVRSKPPATAAIHEAATYRPPSVANQEFSASVTVPVARPSSGELHRSPVASVRDITTSDLDVVFQPIVDLSNGACFALEALTRCKWPEFKNPLTLFEHAQAERCCGMNSERSGVRSLY